MLTHSPLHFSHSLPARPPARPPACQPTPWKSMLSALVFYISQNYYKWPAQYVCLSLAVWEWWREWGECSLSVHGALQLLVMLNHRHLWLNHWAGLKTGVGLLIQLYRSIFHADMDTFLNLFHTSSYRQRVPWFIARNPYCRGWHNTVDLLVLTSLDQLILIFQTMVIFLHKLRNVEVNCTEPSPFTKYSLHTVFQATYAPPP